MKYLKSLLLTACLCAVHLAHAANVDSTLVENPVELDDGGTVHLGDLIGRRPIYLKFWASWCVPCREQMPHLERTYREHHDELEIISVNIWINESETAVSATRNEFGLTVPIATDKQGTLARAFNFFGTPYHVLIDGDGDIVHTGHAADSELDRKIELLAAQEMNELPAITLETSDSTVVDITGRDEGVTALFFTATWCDWYLKDSRPSMSQACIDAQQTMNRIGETLPDLNLLGVASPLWTTEKELEEYVEKFDITHAFAIDKTNDAFFALNVKTFPTLVVMKNGKEISRTSEIVSQHEIAEVIQRSAD